MTDFVGRAGDWVFWTLDDWSESGWINLAITTASRHTPHCPRYKIGWNGERFAVGEAFNRWTARYPDAASVVEDYLWDRLYPKARAAA